MSAGVAQELVVALEHPGGLTVGAHIARRLDDVAAFFEDQRGPLRLRIQWHAEGTRALEMAIGGYVAGERLDLLRRREDLGVLMAFVRPRRRSLSLSPRWPGLPGAFADVRDDYIRARRDVLQRAQIELELLEQRADARGTRLLERDVEVLGALRTGRQTGPGAPPLRADEWIPKVDTALAELCKERPRVVRLRELAAALGRSDRVSLSEQLRQFGFAWMGALPVHT